VTRFRDALLTLSRPDAPARARDRRDRPTATEKALEALNLKVEATLASDPDPVAFRLRVMSAFAEGGIGALSAREMRNLPQLLWGGHDSLLRVPGFMVAYVNRFRAEARAGWASMLARVHFAQHQETDAFFQLSRALLGEFVGLNPRWKWAQAARDLRVFGGEAGVRLTTDAVFAQCHTPAIKTLEGLGFRMGLEQSAFAEAVFRQACARVDMADGGAEDWLWEFALSGKELRYPGSASVLIEAVLRPWLGEAAWQNEARKNATLRRLLDTFGDPRMKPLGWTQVDPTVVKMVRGWLNRRSIELFVRVIDELALDQHWRYRRAFWMSYFERSAIKDAWVVFAPNPLALADQIRKRETMAPREYGILEGATQNNHSILIMTLGDLIIAEYSHNGPVRLWLPESNYRPKIYQQQYSNERFKVSDQYFKHHSNIEFGWQRKVADFIHQHTGLAPEPKKWKP
jgi:hypothetical protein